MVNTNDLLMIFEIDENIQKLYKKEMIQYILLHKSSTDKSWEYHRDSIRLKIYSLEGKINELIRKRIQIKRKIRREING